jgi:hypothetical protein
MEGATYSFFYITYKNAYLIVIIFNLGNVKLDEGRLGNVEYINLQTRI